jgi:hypothetical protein
MYIRRLIKLRIIVLMLVKSLTSLLLKWFIFLGSFTQILVKKHRCIGRWLYFRYQVIHESLTAKGNKSEKFAVWVFVIFCYRRIPRWRKLIFRIFRTCSLSAVSDSHKLLTLSHYAETCSDLYKICRPDDDCVSVETCSLAKDWHFTIA